MSASIEKSVGSATLPELREMAEASESQLGGTPRVFLGKSARGAIDIALTASKSWRLPVSKQEADGHIDYRRFETGSTPIYGRYRHRSGSVSVGIA